MYDICFSVTFRTNLDTLFSGVVTDPENVSNHSDIESSGSTELPQAVSKNKDKVSFICTNVTQSKSTYYLFFYLN